MEKSTADCRGKLAGTATWLLLTMCLCGMFSACMCTTIRFNTSVYPGPDNTGYTFEMMMPDKTWGDTWGLKPQENINLGKDLAAYTDEAFREVKGNIEMLDDNEFNIVFGQVRNIVNDQKPLLTDTEDVLLTDQNQTALNEIKDPRHQAAARQILKDAAFFRIAPQIAPKIFGQVRNIADKAALEAEVEECNNFPINTEVKMEKLKRADDAEVEDFKLMLVVVIEGHIWKHWHDLAKTEANSQNIAEPSVDHLKLKLGTLQSIHSEKGIETYRVEVMKRIGFNTVVDRVDTPKSTTAPAAYTAVPKPADNVPKPADNVPKPPAPTPADNVPKPPAPTTTAPADNAPAQQAAPTKPTPPAQKPTPAQRQAAQKAAQKKAAQKKKMRGGDQ